MELFEYLGKSAAILAMFYGVYYFFVRGDTLFRSKRNFMLIGILASVLLPFAELTKVVYEELPVSVSMALENNATTSVLPAVEVTTVDWNQIVTLLYITGVSIMLVRFSIQLLSLLKILRSSSSERIDSILHIRVDRKISPFSFFKCIVYNPALHTEAELKMILRHEQVHALQWHTVDILIANLVLVLQWMNPFAWLFKSSIEENLEFIADSETAQKVRSKREYQLALIKASSSIPVPALSNNFYQSFIKKRIIMLNKNNSKKTNIWKLSIILPLLAIFLYSFNYNEVVEYTHVSNDQLVDQEYVEVESVSQNTPEEIETANVEIKQEINSDMISVENETLETFSEEITTGSEQVTGDDIIIKITKNTTEADLKQHKKMLKEKYNIDFEYSDLVFNDKEELIGIAIKFNDNEGGNGNYHVIDDAPINSFYFYKRDDGSIGFGSEGMHERRAVRESLMHERKARVKALHDERRKKHIETREKLRETREKLRETEKHIERSSRGINNSEEQYVIAESDMRSADENMAYARARLKESKDRVRATNRRLAQRAKDRAHARYTISSGNGQGDDVYVFSEGDGTVYVDSDHYHRRPAIITKNTTDAELKALKANLAQEGKNFSYRNVKRNDHGEITGIKIKLKNNKGSESVRTIKGDGEAISPIHLDTH